MGEKEKEKVEERKKIPTGGIRITVPKAKCCICAYWVPWLADRRKAPKDCDPTHPGCPVHSYHWKREFPVKEAAVQLIAFLGDEDELAIKKFVETAPNITEIFNAAIAIVTEDYVEGAEKVTTLEEELDSEEEESEEEGSEAVNVEEEDNDDVVVVSQIDPSEK